MRWEHTLACWVSVLRDQADLPARVVLWNGRQLDLGRFDTPKVTLTLRSVSALPLLLRPSLDRLAEGYISGRIDVEGALEDIIQLGYALAVSSGQQPAYNLLERVSGWFAHTRARDRRAIAHHYDVSNEFYRLWLDQNMVYSCAYFEHGDEDLETAQVRKIDHLLTKLQLRPGQRLLDIGCGWGALVLRAASVFGARCVGITLSQQQCELARERVRKAGLEERVEIRLQDYREVSGPFDRITSVGMFEHVGQLNLPLYFSRVCELLADDGLAINHGITSTDADSGATPFGGGEFIARHVFPDGELAHISLALHAAQRGGLEAIDVENLRRHYAHTLKWWAQNFEAHTAEIRRCVDERTYRIWRIYLAGCAHAFARGDIAVYQILCQKARRDADTLPWSRRYMYESTTQSEPHPRSAAG